MMLIQFNNYSSLERIVATMEYTVYGYDMQEKLAVKLGTKED